MLQKYQSRAATRLYWQCWNDEYIVFDETSGHTHQLDPVRAFVLNLLSVSSQSFGAILEELLSIPVLTAEHQLSERLTSILNEFITLGLVEEAVQ